jgi:mRNA interferase MazF
LVKQKSYIPEAGDIIWLSFNPQSGHEQSGRRPALVLSPKEYNAKTDLALLCPVTNQIKGYPFEVLLPENFKISGAILADQIKSLDWKVRNAEYIATLPDNILKDVLKKISALLLSRYDLFLP